MNTAETQPKPTLKKIAVLCMPEIVLAFAIILALYSLGTPWLLGHLVSRLPKSPQRKKRALVG